MRKVRGPLAACVVLACFACGMVACSPPRLQDYHVRPLAQTSFLYASDGSLITALHATENRVALTSAQMTQNIRDAVVAIEDRRFYTHHGVDPEAILRAAVNDLRSGHVVEGGSTITQQLVKNLYVGDDQSFGRKVDEALLAWQLEDRLSKQEILTRYLNTVYFGEGAYGIQAAAKTYIGVDASDLTLAECAMLAGLITAPNHFDPFVRRSSAIGRRNVVLRLMREQGYIAGKQYREAVHERIVLRRDRTELRYPYPYFVDYFKRWFLTNPAFGKTYDDRYRLLFAGGLRITTTLDPGVQAAAQDAVSSVLTYPSDPDAAVTVLDPRTGYVRAMVGGKDADYWANDAAGRVNLATGIGGSGRQTGSAFKAFALVTALEHGISPDTTFAAPSSIDVPLPDGGYWHVTNAEGNGYGTLSLRSATVYSVNTVYAQLIERLTPEAVVETARRMGMRCCSKVANPSTPLQPYLSAVLGSNEANTLEMASAYGTLATGGRHVDPVPVMTVSDANGNLVWQADPRPQQVVGPDVAAAADGILQDTVLYGTGTAANIGRPQIGKTGTDDNHDNAWFIGSVPQLTAAIWVGFHQGQIPMEPPRTRITVFGGTFPAQIWRVLMLRATAGMPAESFPTPEVRYLSVAVDVTQHPYCLPNEYTLPIDVEVLHFIAGTEPDQICTTPTSHQKVIVPSVVGFAQAEGLATLQQSGFYVQVRTEASTQPPGTIIYQVPAGGVPDFQTATITVTVAKAPPPAG
ncbi:MAG: PASTA domain-containing protein [Actinobacteria bacterium]|nr:MAG: PASTA domain-containing protein [Actinomycetota bacterium]TMK93599.1 MAG: PASTA domain-containing protein [Actinomycetota bacterium]TMM21343.1 MAG: PASTA domain-containing protein [Actinomycetota bacterium]